ncbi:MAG: hypothetical protein ND895_18230 [Pyrinomonadaceae bacterium]|nr:hypothetical protein [Pyrinomonadaceae bacterium]
MKRSYLYFLAALLVFSVVALVSLRKSYKSITAQAAEISALPLNSPCTPDAFSLRSQPEATMQLKIVEANCNGKSWNARLTLQNVGPKAVRGYEVANIEDYEYKNGCESSQSVIASEGVLLAPGATKALDFGAGFVNGLSYGKPTGSIQKNVFWIKLVEYSDGTSWREAEQNR